MNSVTDNLQLVLSFLTLGSIIFAIYKSFAEPDIKAKNRMDVMDSNCNITHKNLDQKIISIEEDIKLIKENHLHHIEKDISDIKGDIKAVLAVLNYKDNQK